MERLANRTYKIRGSRITLAQQNAKDRLWDTFGLAPDEVIDFHQIFPSASRHVMEIGTGMGEATAQIAQGKPEWGYVAVEVHPPGIGALLARIEERGLTNLRVIQEDAFLVLDTCVADDSVDQINLFFPDPWPKTKHHKRRIVQSLFLDLVLRKLKIGGQIYIATDWLPYADWIQEEFAKFEHFSGGIISKPIWRCQTRFESQGVRKGLHVTDLCYERIK